MKSTLPSAFGWYVLMGPLSPHILIVSRLEDTRKLQSLLGLLRIGSTLVAHEDVSSLATSHADDERPYCRLSSQHVLVAGPTTWQTVSVNLRYMTISIPLHSGEYAVTIDKQSRVHSLELPKPLPARQPTNLRLSLQPCHHISTHDRPSQQLI